MYVSGVCEIVSEQFHGKLQSRDVPDLIRLQSEIPRISQAVLNTVFIVDEQKRQISLPQILFKSILRCKLDQLMHTGEKTILHFLRCILFD